MPMLDVDRLSVRYGTKQIVDALSFPFPRAVAHDRRPERGR